jgi:hypothetical protein
MVGGDAEAAGHIIGLGSGWLAGGRDAGEGISAIPGGCGLKEDVCQRLPGVVRNPAGAGVRLGAGRREPAGQHGQHNEQPAGHEAASLPDGRRKGETIMHGGKFKRPVGFAFFVAWMAKNIF